MLGVSRQRVKHIRQYRLPLCNDVILCNVVTAVGSLSTKGGIELATLTRMQYGHSQQLSPVLDLPACHGLVVKFKALEVNDQGVRQALDAAALHSIHLSTTFVTLPMSQCKRIHGAHASRIAWSQDMCCKQGKHRELHPDQCSCGLSVLRAPFWHTQQLLLVQRLQWHAGCTGALSSTPFCQLLRKGIDCPPP